MDQQGNVLRLGAWAILFAVMVKLSTLGFFQPLVELLDNPNIQSFLIYIETGRKVRFSPSSEDFFGESPIPEQAAAALPVFSAADAELSLYDAAGRNPDVEALLEKPLNWNLQGGAPTVLIRHTHATESYTKSGEE